LLFQSLLYRLKGMLAVCQLVATLAASLFTGAAIYVSLVEHPARLECGTDLRQLYSDQAIDGER